MKSIDTEIDKAGGSIKISTLRARLRKYGWFLSSDNWKAEQEIIEMGYDSHLDESGIAYITRRRGGVNAYPKK